MAWAGTGTELDPYQITTVDELIETTGSAQHYYFKLMNDLDLSSKSPWITLYSTNFDYGIWVGSLDGNNKTISNLVLNTSSIITTSPPFPVQYQYIGLFGDANVSASEDCYIKNLTIDNCNINIHNYNATNHTFAAALCSRVANRTLENIKITNFSASVILQTGDNVEYTLGAITSHASLYATIKSCSVEYSTASIHGQSDNISDLSFAFFGSSNTNVTQSFNYVKDCFIFSDVRDEFDSPIEDNFISPMYIIAYGTTHDCYVLNVNITSSNYVNGFAKRFVYNDVISNIYSSVNFGNTAASNIFPFNYTDNNNTASNCYYESGSYEFSNPINTNGVTGLTSVQMKDSASYINWDFENVWSQSNDVQNGYPFFRWEVSGSSAPISYDVLTILTPNGGEFYRFGDNITISWDVTQSYELIIQGFTP